MYFYVFIHFCCELAYVAKYTFFGRFFFFKYQFRWQCSRVEGSLKKGVEGQTLGKPCVPSTFETMLGQQPSFALDLRNSTHTLDVQNLNLLLIYIFGTQNTTSTYLEVRWLGKIGGGLRILRKNTTVYSAVHFVLLNIFH